MRIEIYNSQARKRINYAVRQVEQRLIGRRKPKERRTGGSPQSTFAIADEDIEHDTFGDVKLATGATMVSAKTAFSSDVRSIYNPGSIVWEGSVMLLERATLAGADRVDGVKWIVRHAWSATRIRGTANGAISAGTTGTIDNLETINGHYAPAGGIATVYLPTAYVDIEDGVVVWAEIAWRPSLPSSQWEVYSADCTGA